MPQNNFEKLAVTTNGPQGPLLGVSPQPAANLLELYHARHLRDAIAQQVVRLETQSCVISWGVGMAEFEPLYCDSNNLDIRDPLNGDEVRSHYTDLMVAMDHLLEQLGEVTTEG